MKAHRKFPSINEIALMDKLASRAKGANYLGPNASHLEKLKFSLCKKLVVYLTENDLTQAELAKKLKITKTRMNEILNYRLKRVSLDCLVELLDRLDVDTLLVA